jgi:hypothetical protein
MAKKHDAVHFLKAGLSLPEISARLDISISSVVQYLYTQVGEGAIKRSDILFSIPADERTRIENTIKMLNGSTDLHELRRAITETGYALRQEILQTYLYLRDARVSMGDMYEYICQIEVAMHAFIKDVLRDKFGPDENGWWRQGIPVKIRSACAAVREEDPEPAEDSYCYTNFIHLQEILNKQWAIFSQRLPDAVVKEKSKLLSNLGRLNRIRNSIMHPVKQLTITEDDFLFVREFSATIMPAILVQKKQTGCGFSI